MSAICVENTEEEVGSGLSLQMDTEQLMKANAARRV